MTLNDREGIPGKLPAITITFWIMKICATTLGETGGDLLAQTLHVGYSNSSLIFIGFFIITLLIQLSTRTYHPAIYWMVIVATSTSGTTLSDFMDRTLAVGYMYGSLLLVILLSIVLFTWKLMEKSLSVSDISSRRGEIFYWIAILVSNTLGTALGDMLADDYGLGFSGGVILIGGLLLLVMLLYQFTKLSHVLLFWAAFVLTRPFGATFGDLLTKTHEQGGLNFGTLGTSMILFGTLSIFVLMQIKQLLKKEYQ